MLSLVCKGQNSIISGYVTDAETGLALKDINVKTNCISGGAVTNDKGFFSFKIEQNKCIVTVSHIAYNTYVFEFNNSKTNKGKC